MCDYEPEDRCIVLHYAARRARKPHRCGECGRVIAAGETYQHTGMLFEGHKYTNKCCSHCVVARQWLIAECGGYMFEHAREDIIEHFRGEGYKQLARLAAGIRRRWRGFKRDLLPIPTRPPTTHELERLEHSNA